MSAAVLVPGAIGGVIGAFVGSFLNVCIHRLPRNESIVLPGSRCYACGTRVQWYDNLPLLSWLLLRGRCRWCGTPFSFRYWLLELTTALITGAVTAWVFHPQGLVPPAWLPDTVATRALVAGALLVFAYAAVVATVIDLAWLIIPDEISLPLLVVAPGLALLVGIAPDLGWSLDSWFFGGLSGTAWQGTRGLGHLLALVLPTLVLLPMSLLVARRIYGALAVAGGWHAEDFRGLRVGALWFVGVQAMVLAAVTVLVIAGHRYPVCRALAVALGQALLGGTAAWWLIWLIGLVGTVAFRRNAMGYGDVKFFAALGFLLGPAGVLVAFAAATACACLVSVPLQALRRERELPFGPYLAVGAAITLVWGPGLWRSLTSWLAG
jgi:leader peptidase (prepilin peptidase)/N-methyltransferase